MIEVTVRDLAVLESAYGRVLSARPTSVEPVRFRLEPSNRLKTSLAGEAVRDAARRARAATEGAGARLGAAKVIDPSGGVCQTQVLAGWPSYVGGQRPTDVANDGEDVVVTARRAFAPPPPPPPPPAPGAAPVQVTLQPPLETLEAQACVVYALRP